VRRLQLTKSGHNKLRAHQKELKAQDLEDSIKSLPPGEWCILELKGSGEEVWLAHVNPLINEKYACIQIIEVLKGSEHKSIAPERIIKDRIKSAFARRTRFKGYGEGCRLFYGGSDGLAGLIIDLFENACIIQINSAGVDRYREKVREAVAEVSGVKAYFLDNPKYREKESLPIFEPEAVPDLTVKENSLVYHLNSVVIQKVGFYYDHRENRLQLQGLLSRLAHIPEIGLDLFCYAGSWGLNALKAGVGRVDFVDQGDFDGTVHEALKSNGLEGKGNFKRADVFKFLDDVIAKGIKYDLVLCDPPAFAKSALQKSQALDGYSKLHRKVFKTLSAGAIVAFSSCTHYVGHDEFQKNILDAAHKEGKKIRLLYCGMQGWDHPVTSLDDRANYIKSYFYTLE
jgi:23S rRNA (cytosine1962-C5)-methyltransferase